MIQKGKIKQMLQNAREYRIHCYRRMQLADMADDSCEYFVQEYWQERTEASENAARLLDDIDTHTNKLNPEEQSELLLTAFVAINAAFRDYELSLRAAEMAEMLLPNLPDSRVKLYLQVYLYHEIGDDIIHEEIDRLMEMIETGDDKTEEDRCLMELYRQMSEQDFA